MTTAAESPIAYGEVVRRDAVVVARDGTRLATDVYLPGARGEPVPGRFPALVERTPYSRRRPFIEETGRYFAERGYAVVAQDVRGRFDSEGCWAFLPESEGRDGADTLAWMTAQPWCNGRIGTIGLSYSAANQQPLALQHPPGLDAQCLLDGGYDYFHRTLRHSGACELGVVLPYAMRLAHDSQELRSDPDAARAFAQACDQLPAWLRALPLQYEAGPLGHAPAHMEWFLDVLRGGEYGPSWQGEGISLREHVERYPDVPVFHEASWYGHHVWASGERFNRLREQCDAPQRLLIGPWLHGYDDFARSWSGEVDFGSAAVVAVNDVRLRWFDRWLKDLPTGIDEGPSVRVFVMGGGSGRRDANGRLEHGGRWRDGDEWPLSETTSERYFFHADGALRHRAPAASVPPSVYTFDPRDPVPTIGGGTQNSLWPHLIRGGAFDQRGRADLWVCRDTRPLAERADVLVFQTAPLRRPVEVVGPISVTLWVASSAPDSDFTAKLIDVYPPSAEWPAGFAMNLCDGIVRMRYRDGFDAPVWMRAGDVYEVTIELQGTGNLFAVAHRIRLDVSSSNFPHFDVNPNTGGALGRDTDVAVARNVVYHDAARPSHVVLPVISPSG